MTKHNRWDSNSITQKRCILDLGFHLDPELQIALKWCLGLNSRRSSFALCPDVALDPLGHHAVTCLHGWDVGHNRLCDEFLSPSSHSGKVRNKKWP